MCGLIDGVWCERWCVSDGGGDVCVVCDGVRECERCVCVCERDVG